MCYNFRTSIVSYTIGITSAIFALCTRQFVLGVLILAYSQMQLSEMIIWYGIDHDNTDINRNGTSFGKYLLATHNIAIGLGVILSIIFISKRKITMTDFIPLIIGIMFFLYIVFIFYLPGKYPDVTYQLDPSCTKHDCQTQGNRLKWTYPHSWYAFSYIISLVIMVVWCRPISSKIFMIFMFSTLLLITTIITPKVVGSVWCFSTAILAPVMVIGNYILIRNTPSSEILV